jgi:hypothetical protein
LRQYNDGIAKEDVHLYTPGTAVRLQNTSDAPKKPVLTGLNPPTGAVIYYSLKEKPKTEIKIEILDGAGSVIRRFSSTKIDDLDEPLDPDDKKPEPQIKVEAGMNRLVWDLRYQSANHVPDYYLWEYKSGAKGPLAVPGKYEVRVTVDGKTQTAPFEVKLDPRVNVSQADLQKQFDLLMQVHEQLGRIYDVVNQIQDVRSQVSGIKRRLPENDKTLPVATTADSLSQKLLAVRDDLVQMQIRANEDSLAYPQRPDSKLAALAIAIGDGTDSAPTEAEYQVYQKLKRQSDDAIARWSQIRTTDLVAFEKMVAEQNIQAIVVPAGDRESTSASHK